MDIAQLKKENKLQPSKGRNGYYTQEEEEEEAIIRELNINLPTDTPITKMQRLNAMHFIICLADLGARKGEIKTLKW